MYCLSMLTLIWAFMCTLLVSVSTCDSGHGVRMPTSGMGTATPSMSGQLPRFSDWRVAYFAGDLRLHAIS